jgi:hypothetical protein
MGPGRGGSEELPSPTINRQHAIFDLSVFGAASVERQRYGHKRERERVKSDNSVRQLKVVRTIVLNASKSCLLRRRTIVIYSVETWHLKLPCELVNVELKNIRVCSASNACRDPFCAHGAHVPNGAHLCPWAPYGGPIWRTCPKSPRSMTPFAHVPRWRPLWWELWGHGPLSSHLWWALWYPLWMGHGPL